MTLYEIYWFPKVPFDCEKRDTLVLCNTRQEAMQIAKEHFKNVQVSEVVRYADIAGGREGEEYWAELVMYKGKVISYYEYRNLKNAE